MRCFPTIRPHSRASWTLNRTSISVWRSIGQKTPLSNAGEALSDTGDDQLANARLQQEDGREQATSSESQRPSATSPSSKLPLSPLMDPNLIAARRRYRTPKPAPSGELSAFSKKLERNPFAQALASPIRQCRFTGLRLPGYFHLDFGLQKHPTTGKLWHLPRLAAVPGIHAADKGNDDPAQGEDEGVSESQEMPNSSTSKTTTQRESYRTSTTTYFGAQRSTIRFISCLDRQQYTKVSPFRWKRGAIPNLHDIVWREDMDTYVLGLMRKSLLRELQFVSSRPSGYVASCGYGQVGNHPQLGAALWLGPGGTESSILVEGTEIDGKADVPGGSAGPPPYAMLLYRGRYIPVFNLQTLLGHKYLQHLRESSPLYQGEHAVIREKRNTVKVQMDLWKLMGYLAADV